MAKHTPLWLMLRDQPMHIACIKAYSGMDTHEGLSAMRAVHFEKKFKVPKSHEILAVAWLLFSVGMAILGGVFLINL